MANSKKPACRNDLSAKGILPSHHLQALRLLSYDSLFKRREMTLEEECKDWRGQDSQFQAV